MKALMIEIVDRVLPICPRSDRRPARRGGTLGTSEARR